MIYNLSESAMDFLKALHGRSLDELIDGLMRSNFSKNDDYGRDLYIGTRDLLTSGILTIGGQSRDD